MTTDHIRIGDVAPRVQYAADGVQTGFVYPFPIFAADDLGVWLDDERRTAGFTVAGAGDDAGGTVTFETAPPAGVRVTLLRDLVIARTTDFQEGGAFRARTLNDELDYQTAALQQLDVDRARTLRLAPADEDIDATLPPRAQRAGRLLGFDGFGAPTAVDLAAAPADAAGSIVVATGSAAPRTLAVRFADRANILDFGARRDGTTNDLPAFQAARAAAGAQGAVWLPGPGTYRFAGSRPDLSGCVVEADPGVVVTVDENPNTRDMALATPLTVQNPVHQTLRRKPANHAVPLALHGIGTAAAAALACDQRIEALNFDDGWTGASITGTATKGAFTGTLAADSVSWDEPFASGQEGVFLNRPPVVGEQYEVTFRDTGAAAVDGGFVSAVLITDLKRYDFALFSGLPQMQVIETPGGVVKALATPNGGAYALAPAGASVTLGLRLVDAGTVEVYVNDWLIHRHGIANFIADIGFTASWHVSGTVTLRDPVRTTRHLPQSPRPLSVGVIGDSISYGAWASLPWPELLRAAAVNLPGIGPLTIDNYAVSATDSTHWATAVDDLDLSGHSHVLVMVGTNDVQAQTPLATFRANLAAIADGIVAAGATPIFGVFPVFTRNDISGVVGVGAAHYEKGGAYRAAVKRFCAQNGHEMANVADAFGTCLGWYNDNIHPTVEGQVAVAKAFAAALCRAVRPRPVAGNGNWIRPTLLNGWTGFSPTHQEPQFRRRPDGMVELRGSVKGGTVATTAPIFELPPGFRPNVIRPFGVTTGDPTASAGELFVFPAGSSGAVALGKGSNTKLNLNGIVFEAEA